MHLLLELDFKKRNATRLLTAFGGFIGYMLIKGNTLLSMALGALLALMLMNTTLVYVICTTIKRDITAAIRFLKLNLYLWRLEKKQWSLARIFQEKCSQHPTKKCFIMDDRVMTFQDVEDYSNKIGNYFLRRNLRHGDCVALMMESRPEYATIWLGLSKIGIVTALMNTNQRRDTLRHSIKVANAKAIIIGTELVKVLEEILNNEEFKSIPIYQFSDEDQRDNDNFHLIKEDFSSEINHPIIKDETVSKSYKFIIGQDAIDLTKELGNQKIESLKSHITQCKPKDKLMYVYTSGTTGLPKAAVITNLRYVFMTSGTHYMVNLKENDIVYDALPLYHTSGGIVGIGNAFVFGCTVALRKKFSASNFWKDCIKYNATAAQYIGELCRYLLSTPRKAEDTQHQIRLMYGNGLRPQIWSQFTSRFNIPNIAELYGSTEGNSNLANAANQVGAIGFIPILIRSWFPVQAIRIDEESGEPLRDRKGFCISSLPGETGLLIGKVDERRAVTSFHGYADQKASEKKLLRNVFRKNDVYFNTGDMVVSDILGYFYFKDRTGDTFRWRGENVSTQEVEAIITNIIGLHDCVVYGIEIPHVEGKAGMAAIEDPERKVDLDKLSIGIRGSLPPYAQPLFIRLMKEIPRTTTFKMKKRELMLEGYDLHKITDPIYYLNRDGIYRSLTHEQYNSIINGDARL